MFIRTSLKGERSKALPAILPFISMGEVIFLSGDGASIPVLGAHLMFLLAHPNGKFRRLNVRTINNAAHQNRHTFHSWLLRGLMGCQP
jgi:hypothetical protein